MRLCCCAIWPKPKSASRTNLDQISPRICAETPDKKKNSRDRIRFDLRNPRLNSRSSTNESLTQFSVGAENYEVCFCALGDLS